eukprot:1661868-Prorocentrum_lima.AAC.1
MEVVSAHLPHGGRPRAEWSEALEDLPVDCPRLVWLLDANAALAHVPAEEEPLVWNVEERCLGT